MAGTKGKLHPKMIEKQYKKGQSGNPEGKKPDPIKRALKELTWARWIEIIEGLLSCNMAYFDEFMRDPKNSILEKMTARAIMDIMKKGDWDKLYKIMETIFGKRPELIHLTTDNKTTIHNLIDKEKLKIALKEIEEDV